VQLGRPPFLDRTAARDRSTEHGGVFWGWAGLFRHKPLPILVHDGDETHIHLGVTNTRKLSARSPIHRGHTTTRRTPNTFLASRVIDSNSSFCKETCGRCSSPGIRNSTVRGGIPLANPVSLSSLASVTALTHRLVMAPTVACTVSCHDEFGNKVLTPFVHNCAMSVLFELCSGDGRQTRRQFRPIAKKLPDFVL